MSSISLNSSDDRCIAATPEEVLDEVVVLIDEAMTAAGYILDADESDYHASLATLVFASYRDDEYMQESECESEEIPSSDLEY